MSRVIMPVVALALFIALSAGSCGGKAATTSASPSGAAQAGSASASAPGSASAAGQVEIRVTVSGGKVEPRPSVHKVDRGRVVRIIVTSDRADQLHVHGYDKEAALRPGTATVVEFTADQDGRFEVETHESGLQLFQLQVS